MHDQSNLQEVVAKLKQEAVELQTRIDEHRVELVSIQELETPVNLKSRELATLQANIDKLHENAAAGTSLFRPMPIPPDIPRTEQNIELVLEALESAGCLPPGVKSGQACKIWSQSHCDKVEGVSRDGIPIFMKDFATLEFWNIST
ncbi:hypothetical protein R1flu_024172 [Riccia fluitans]|uniref:Uncharacterized protein n=1 Tax=Riccia fluitans TaxID=41844 RepID=A0ABD1XU56_9MARC